MMIEQVLATVRRSIAGHEGLVLRAYDDATGRVIQPNTVVRGWVTVGYGRNLIGKGLSLPEAEHLLDNDLKEITSTLDQLAPWWRREVDARQIALIELAYNMGTQRFLSGWPNTVSAWKAGDHERVARALENSKWRQQVGEGRARTIIQLVRSGRYA